MALASRSTLGEADASHAGVLSRGVKATGTVVVEASVNTKGEVTDARVLSGPDELRRTALQSVLQWHYAPDSGVPPRVQVSIKFDGPPADVAVPKPGVITVRYRRIRRRSRRRRSKVSSSTACHPR